MKNKIKSITEKIVSATTLPDGFYSGIWGGSEIELKIKGKTYTLFTEEGVRGIDIKVVVEVKDGEATFETLNV
jgi:hypothetical protein